MRRITAFILIVSLLASTLLMIESASAGVNQPSVPQFTVKLVDRSYDVGTTYSTNPYTGETITHPGYHVRNITLDVTIKNQPFTPTTISNGNTTGLFYNVQAKKSFGNWSSTPNSDDHDRYAVTASTSESTLVTFILNSDGWYVSEGNQIDVRVQAVIGYSYCVWSRGGGIIPICTQFKLLAASDWSKPQTITYGSATTPAPTNPPVQPTTTPSTPPSSNSTAATNNPTATPIQPNTQTGFSLGLEVWQITTIVLAVIVAFLLVGLVALWRRLPKVAS